MIERINGVVKLTIYHWLVILLVVFALLFRGWQKGSKRFILIAFVLMFCIHGLRDNATIGNDSRTSYRWEFYSMEGKSWDSLGGIRNWMHIDQEGEDYSGRDRNFGTKWLMKAVYDLTDGDYQWFLVAVAVIILGSESVLILKYSPSPLQSVLYYLGLLYFSFHMSGTKQTLAMSLIIFSFMAIIDRKPLRFVILVIIASFFHFPALVFLPAYWVANMKLERGYLIFLSGLLILTYLFRDRLISFMTEAYYSSEMATTSQLRFLANKVIIMLIIIVAALVIRPPRENDRLYRVLLHLMGIAAVIQTFAGYSNVFERLADYYFQFAVIFIPMVFEGVRTERRYLDTATTQLVCSFGPYIFGSFAIWRFLDTITSDGHFVPFRFFFQ